MSARGVCRARRFCGAIKRVYCGRTERQQDKSTGVESVSMKESPRKVIVKVICLDCNFLSGLPLTWRLSSPRAPCWAVEASFGPLKLEGTASHRWDLSCNRGSGSRPLPPCRATLDLGAGRDTRWPTEHSRDGAGIR